MTIHVQSSTTIRQKVTDIPDLTGAVMVLVATSPLSIRTETAAAVGSNVQFLEATLDENIWLTPGTWRLQFQGEFQGIPLILDERTVEVEEKL